MDSAKDRRAKFRVLFLDHCTPTPDQDSGSIDALNHMLLLREMDFQVTFIPEDNFLYSEKYTSALQRSGIEVLYSPYLTSVEEHLKEVGPRYDLVIMCRVSVASRNLEGVRRHCHNAKVWFHTVDLHYVRMSREALVTGDQLLDIEADRIMEREVALIKACDMTTVVSIEEMSKLQELVSMESVRLLPYARNIRGTQKSYSERRNIVFVGGYRHTPNVDAVRYFVIEVMPILRSLIPGVHFFLVGSGPHDDLFDLSGDDVTITGHVGNLESLLDEMRVSVAPLRYGSGIKGKIGTALSVGLPVVATSIAVEGMSLTDGENILIADTPSAFAEAVYRLYNDASLWARLSISGLAFAEKFWGAEASWSTLAGILVDLGFPVPEKKYPLSLYSEQYDFRFASAENTRPLIHPISSVRGMEEFERVMGGETIREMIETEKEILNEAGSEFFSLDGLCIPCNQKRRFLVHVQPPGAGKGDGCLPNWREELICPSCGMNNRQRLVATLVAQKIAGKESQELYFMEQVTPIFRWATSNLKRHKLFGSEYLGHEFTGGSIINGIRHEDVLDLSLKDDQLDLIVSNDVLEHVPDPERALAECARVLKPGGCLLATIPFHARSATSVRRAQLKDGELQYLLPEVYHGNPISEKGSLVFTDIGWDLFLNSERSGFTDSWIEVYGSYEFGHLGGGQLVFWFKK